MPGKPPEPPAAEGSAHDPDGAPGEQPGDHTTGPLRIERYRKEDGRALLLYSRSEDAAR